MPKRVYAPILALLPPAYARDKIAKMMAGIGVKLESRAVRENGAAEGETADGG
jgi:hypothetical protein